MKQKVLTSLFAFFLACASNVHAEASLLPGDGSEPSSLEALCEQAEGIIDGVRQWWDDYVHETGEAPSHEVFEAHMLKLPNIPQSEEVEAALEAYEAQVSAGHLMPIPAYRVVALVALSLSYYYPQVWPLTLIFLLDAEWAIPGLIDGTFKGFVNIGLKSAYYTMVLHQFEQFQREFRAFLHRQGSNWHEYWRSISATVYATYKYGQLQRIL